MNRLTQLGADMVSLWGTYWESYLNGIKNTLILALVATLIGCLIGFICGILQTIPYAKTDSLVKRFFLKLIRVIIRIYVEVFRGTPMVLQAVFVYYGLPYFTNNTLMFNNIWAAAILVVSINTGAYMAETVRGGIMSVDSGQTEGAKAIGMNHFQTMVYVIFPPGLKEYYPPDRKQFHYQCEGYLCDVHYLLHGVFRGSQSGGGSHLSVFPLRNHRDDRLSVHDTDCILPAAEDGEMAGGL